MASIKVKAGALNYKKNEMVEMCKDFINDGKKDEDKAADIIGWLVMKYKKFDDTSSNTNGFFKRAMAKGEILGSVKARAKIMEIIQNKTDGLTEKSSTEQWKKEELDEKLTEITINNPVDTLKGYLEDPEIKVKSSFVKKVTKN